jgi:bacterioferritin (cytochrome b1)
MMRGHSAPCRSRREEVLTWSEEKPTTAKLIHDEEHHIDFLETQIDLVIKLGLELYAQHHIGELDEG